MKVRTGFVSNSSSCSFTCPCCDNHQFGWDWDEDPVCDECRVHMNSVKGTFIDHLAKKYNIDISYERMQFRAAQDDVLEY